MSAPGVSDEHEVVVVGGGLAGLACATRLVRDGLAPLVVEAGERPGGRVRTDEVDGFRLDRGFQVLLPSYPSARELLDLDALELGSFRPGALVRVGPGRNGFTRVGDPRREPATLPRTLGAPVGSLGDKLRVLRLDARLRRYEAEGEGAAGGSGTSALEALREAGIGEGMLERFFRPFLGGVFLERALETDARFLAFVWRMFSRSRASLPAGGMEAIPRQLAAALPSGTLRTGTPVERVDAEGVVLASGERLAARAVVLATDGSTARHLLGIDESLPWRPVTCFYYEAPRSPVAGPWLVLDGEGRGPVNNLCVPSQVAPGYAPAGRHLVSVTVLGDPARASEPAVRAELVRWFGAEVPSWRPLASYAIRRALPGRTAPLPRDAARGTFVCGDHTASPSIEGALASGRRAAREVAAALGIALAG